MRPQDVEITPGGGVRPLETERHGVGANGRRMEDGPKQGGEATKWKARKAGVE